METSLDYENENSQITCNENSNLPDFDKVTPVNRYAPEFSDTELDLPTEPIDQRYFSLFEKQQQQNSTLQDIMLANKIVNSGVPNRYGCRIPLCTQWNLECMEQWLLDYHDKEVMEWLRYGFSISREDNFLDPEPATCNHADATLYPEVIDNYIAGELKWSATLGPFKILPFIKRIGISPLSTRPKRETGKRKIIMDLFWFL